jgi:hypothetical protein
MSLHPVLNFILANSFPRHKVFRIPDDIILPRFFSQLFLICDDGMIIMPLEINSAASSSALCKTLPTSKKPNAVLLTRCYPSRDEAALFASYAQDVLDEQAAVDAASSGVD